MRQHNFVLKFNGRANILHTPIAVSLPSEGNTQNQKYQTRCIWDTGCSNTTITQKVVDALGLKPTGRTTVNTASETNKPTDTYEVDIFLSDGLVFKNMTVNLGVIIDGIDCLLGLDIINTGDFSITNLHGNTCMSFRHPSSHEVDFTQQTHKEKTKLKLNQPPAKNAPCPCGSGINYKKCHGKS